MNNGATFRELYLESLIPERKKVGFDRNAEVSVKGFLKSSQSVGMRLGKPKTFPPNGLSFNTRSHKTHFPCPKFAHSTRASGCRRRFCIENNSIRKTVSDQGSGSPSCDSLCGTLEAAPQRFRIEIESHYGSDRLTFEPGELIDRVTQAYHIKSGRTKNSSWCKSYSAFKDKSWDMSVSSKGRHYRSSTKTRALGVHPPDGGNLRAIGQVCNYNSGGKFDNDVIEATFNWGWIDVGPTTPRSIYVIKIWDTKRLKVKDGRRAYFSRSLPRHLDTNEGYYVTASDVSGADTGLRRYVSIFLGGKNENGR